MVFLRTHQPYSGTEVLMETKLERIAEISANSPRPEFTSLYHLINKEMLLQCHKELDGNKAVGVDEITKKEYERNLEQNIDDLVERLKRKSYKPQPSIILQGQSKRAVSVSDYKHLIFWDSHSIVGVHAKACHI